MKKYLFNGVIVDEENKGNPTVKREFVNKKY